jgi:hypothetical protein
VSRHASRLDAVVSLLLFVLAVCWFQLSAYRTLELRDEGYILERSLQTAEGQLPHRDFEDVYGPGVFFTTGWILEAFDREVWGVRLALTGIKGVAVVASYLLARSLVPVGFAVLAALASTAYWGRPVWMLNTPYAALYTITVAQVAMVLLVRGLARRSAGGEFVAGLAAGSAILFKQSLGAMLAFGSLLAVWALVLLDPSRAARDRGAAALGFWVIAGVAPLVPVWRYLGPSEYVLHFLPLHVLMALIAAASVRSGGLPPVRSTARRLLPLGIGIAAPMVVVASLYAVSGGLGRLLRGMFVLPGLLENYAVAPNVLHGADVALAVGLLGVVAAGLLAIRRSALLALAMLVSSLLLAARGASGRWGEAGILALHGAAPFAEYQIALLAALAVIQLVPRLLKVRSERDLAELRALLTLLFGDIFLCFQIFPRSGWNVWPALGATTPLLALLLWRAHRWAASGAEPQRRRALAAVLVALVPAWLVASPLIHVIGQLRTGARRELDLPHLHGIALDPDAAAALEIDAVVDLVRHLREAAPSQAPVLLMDNEVMLLFLSDRDSLFPDAQCRLFLLSWGLLPVGPRSGIDEGDLLRDLQAHPDAIVVDRPDDPASNRLRAGLPLLAAHLDAAFEVSARFGPYAVLRRMPHGERGPSNIRRQPGSGATRRTP